MTQETLAQRLGVSMAQMRMFEDGEKRIPPRRLIRSATFLGVPIDTFFEGAPQSASSSDLSQVNADVMRFLAMPESFALVSAFVALSCVKQRQAVVDYARKAGDDDRHVGQA